MHEGCARDRSLIAAVHVERVDPVQVHKGSVLDGRLFAAARVEVFDSAQITKAASVIVAWLQPPMLSDWIPCRCTKVTSVICLQ